jgi:hypothetical protein
LKFQAEIPWTINIHVILKMKGMRENRSFFGGGTRGKWTGTRKGGLRVYMVDIFCTNI